MDWQWHEVVGSCACGENKPHWHLLNIKTQERMVVFPPDGQRVIDVIVNDAMANSMSEQIKKAEPKPVSTLSVAGLFSAFVSFSSLFLYLFHAAYRAEPSHGPVAFAFWLVECVGGGMGMIYAIHYFHRFRTSLASYNRPYKQHVKEAGWQAKQQYSIQPSFGLKKRMYEWMGKTPPQD